MLHSAIGLVFMNTMHGTTANNEHSLQSWPLTIMQPIQPVRSAGRIKANMHKSCTKTCNGVRPLQGIGHHSGYPMESMGNSARTR